MSNRMYCFRASYNFFDLHSTPPWLCIDTNWQGYRIYTLPWIVEVAQALGNLTIDNTSEDWVMYLESIGLTEVTPVDCEDLFEDKLYC